MVEVEGNCSNYLLAIRLGPARRLSQVSTLCGCSCSGVKVKYFCQGLSLLRFVRFLPLVAFVCFVERLAKDRHKSESNCVKHLLLQKMFPLFGIFLFSAKKENARTIRIDLRGKFVLSCYFNRIIRAVLNTFKYLFDTMRTIEPQINILKWRQRSCMQQGSSASATTMQQQKSLKNV